MPIWRMQCSFGADSAFPRDRFVITPHFNDAGALTDPDALAEDLATALAAWCLPAREVQVKAYDAQGAVPVYPQADVVKNAATYPVSNYPREIALCLSFYGTRNVGRQRGRLYVPLNVLGLGADVRPSLAARTKVGDLVPIFTGLGGTDVDWCVFSRTTNTPHSVTNWYVDDEWDTVRSRGLRSTTRLEGTTTEG
jgi:hypothetical protein